MKKIYMTPEIESIKLTLKDVILGSPTESMPVEIGDGDGDGEEIDIGGGL